MLTSASLPIGYICSRQLSYRNFGNSVTHTVNPSHHFTTIIAVLCPLPYVHASESGTNTRSRSPAGTNDLLRMPFMLTNHICICFRLPPRDISSRPACNVPPSDKIKKKQSGDVVHHRTINYESNRLVRRELCKSPLVHSIRKVHLSFEPLGMYIALDETFHLSTRVTAQPRSCRIACVRYPDPCVVLGRTPTFSAVIHFRVTDVGCMLSSPFSRSLSVG